LELIRNGLGLERGWLRRSARMSSCRRGRCIKVEQPEENAMLTIVIVVLLVLAIGGAGWGHSRWGYAGWSPAGVIVAALVIMWLTGHLHW
jgi:hypothetical protein